LTSVALRTLNEMASLEVHQSGAPSSITYVTATAPSAYATVQSPDIRPLIVPSRLVTVEVAEAITVVGHDERALFAPDPHTEERESGMIACMLDREYDQFLSAARKYSGVLYGWLSCTSKPDDPGFIGAPPLYYVPADAYQNTVHGHAFNTRMKRAQGIALSGMDPWVTPNITSQDSMHNGVVCQICGIVDAISQVLKINNTHTEIHMIGDSTWMHAFALYYDDTHGYRRGKRRLEKNDALSIFGRQFEDQYPDGKVELLNAVESMYRQAALADDYKTDPEAPVKLLHRCLHKLLPSSQLRIIRFFAICGAHMGGDDVSSMARQVHASRQLFGRAPLLICGTWNTHFDEDQEYQLEELADALHGGMSCSWGRRKVKGIADALTGPFQIELSASESPST